MASFALVEEYHQYPGGVCYLCRSSKRCADERIVDTGIHIEFEGRLYVCEACVREMGGLLDELPIAQRVAGLLAEVDRERARADEFEDRYNGILDAVADRVAKTVEAYWTEPDEHVKLHAAAVTVPDDILAERAKNKGGRPRLPRDEHGNIIR